MPIAPIKFRPGINTIFTETLNEGGWSGGNLIRFVGGLPQKLGGWAKFWPFSMASAIRALWDWRDFDGTARLAVGAQSTLGVITSDVLADITPQTLASSFVPNFTTTSASATVTITDTNISNLTTYDSVFFNTPVSVGGLILSGVYPIALITGATSYQITASASATATVTTVAITGATNANPCVVTANSHGRSNGDFVFIAGVGGMTQINSLIFSVAGVTGNTFQLVGINSSAYGVYTSGGTVYGGIVPVFTTTSGSPTVSVQLPDHGLSVSGRITLPTSTSVGGLSLIGTYSVATVASADVFTITAAASASSTATALMNSGSASVTYYIALGPAPAGAGYGLGTYGTGTYGLGSASTAQTGTAITATDWTLDNWGQTLVACPEGGALYVWDPDGGFTTARPITGQNAPIFNAGMFVAMPAQILVAYGSTTQRITNAIGVYQDPLLVRWSDQDNYEDWSISTTDQVGSLRLPRGSEIIGGMQGPNQGYLWTDAGVWSMTYAGQPLVFTFNEIGSGCGLIAKHAAAVLGEQVLWMGTNNYFMMTGSGAQELPCTVWDDVFQDLDTTNQHKCWAWAVSSFNEVWFFYPSAQDNTGECSRYAKLTLSQPYAWDKGALPRSAGIDSGVLDYPLAGTSAGLIYQHESGTSADGQPMDAYVASGDVMIASGDQVMFVDQVRPDMKYEMVGDADSANMYVTITAENDITGEVMTSGAMAYDEDTTYLTPRVRGHRVRFTIGSNDLNSWWRVGLMRYRAAPDGRK